MVSYTKQKNDFVIECSDKDQVTYKAHLQHGYALKDIAEYMGVRYTTVSRAIKKIEGEDEK